MFTASGRRKSPKVAASARLPVFHKVAQESRAPKPDSTALTATKSSPIGALSPNLATLVSVLSHVTDTCLLRHLCDVTVGRIPVQQKRFPVVLGDVILRKIHTVLP